MKLTHLSLALSLAFAFTLAGCGHPVNMAASRVNAGSTALRKVPLRVAPDTYYQAAQGKQGHALLQALNAIVAAHKDLTYIGARDAMFGTIDDPDNDNKVTDIYLGRTLDAVSDNQTAYRNGTGLNAEHTWPQSKGAEGIAKDDLHHLFPADVHANGVRSSFPFGVVTGTPLWADGGSKLGMNAQGVEVFEPRDPQKGDTARAIFYFYTVYGPSGHIDTSNFKVEEPVLRQWVSQDPVDAREAARNDAIQALQGNRNPFVDHPEWVAAIGEFMAAE